MTLKLRKTFIKGNYDKKKNEPVFSWRGIEKNQIGKRNKSEV